MIFRFINHIWRKEKTNLELVIDIGLRGAKKKIKL